MSTYRLDKLFSPRSVAVIGASPREKSPGRAVLKNLCRGGFEGEIDLVNPHYDAIEGVMARLLASGPMGAEFMPMVQLVGLRNAGDFADLTDLKTQACGRGHAEPTAATIWAMRDGFVAIANRRLQRFYRKHFAGSPS
jgi:hypothetical protein